MNDAEKVSVDGKKGGLCEVGGEVQELRAGVRDVDEEGEEMTGIRSGDILPRGVVAWDDEWVRMEVGVEEEVFDGGGMQWSAGSCKKKVGGVGKGGEYGGEIVRGRERDDMNGECWERRGMGGTCRTRSEG